MSVIAWLQQPFRDPMCGIAVERSRWRQDRARTADRAVGTFAVLSVSETTVNVAGVPFNVTLVDVYFASKYVPRESCGSSMF